VLWEFNIFRIWLFDSKKANRRDMKKLNFLIWFLLFHIIFKGKLNKKCLGFRKMWNFENLVKKEWVNIFISSFYYVKGKKSNIWLVIQEKIRQMVENWKKKKKKDVNGTFSASN
jgi:hypothetical protein